MLNALCEPNFRGRPRDEIACTRQAPVEHRAGAPVDADVSGLDHLERDDGGVNQVRQLVDEESEPLVVANDAAVDGRLIACRLHTA